MEFLHKRFPPFAANNTHNPKWMMPASSSDSGPFEIPFIHYTNPSRSLRKTRKPAIKPFRRQFRDGSFVILLQQESGYCKDADAIVYFTGTSKFSRQ